MTTSTTLSTPKLSEVARHLVIPEGIVTSVFPRVQRRMGAVGLGFDPWQVGFGTVALGCREDGKYAASVGGVVASIPRQVGKTYTVGGIGIGLCLEFPGLQMAWTSHHNRTTTKTFKSMSAIVKRKQIYPLLDHGSRSDGIRASNGEQEIRFANDSIIMFGAREQGFGRGLDELDIEVFDEAQILTLKALEDMVPATNQARNPHGGLLFFLGTPPRPSDPGEAFTTKREQAISGRKKNIVYIEIGADPRSGIDDREQWPIMNPSYPLRTPADAIERMRENIPDDDAFNREARGIWPKTAFAQQVIDEKTWRDRFDTADDGVRPDALGVDMSHNGEISISACWTRGEYSHAEEVWAGVSESDAVKWIVERTLRRTPIIIDSASPAAALAPDLKASPALRMGVRLTSAWDMAKACGLAVYQVKAATLSHGGQSSITEALKGARKRPIRDAGGWGWDRRDETVNIAPLVAWTLAVFGAVSQRKKSNSGGREAILL